MNIFRVHSDCPGTEEQCSALEASLLSGWLRGREAAMDVAPGTGEGVFVDKKVAGAASLCDPRLLKSDSSVRTHFRDDGYAVSQQTVHISSPNTYFLTHSQQGLSHFKLSFGGHTKGRSVLIDY